MNPIKLKRPVAIAAAVFLLLAGIAVAPAASDFAAGTRHGPRPLSDGNFRRAVLILLLASGASLMAKSVI